MGLVDKGVMPIATIRGPIESFEWKHIYRLSCFVAWSSEYISPLCKAFVPGARDYRLIKEEDAKKLASMAIRFQIHATGPKDSPDELLLGLASNLLLLDGSPERVLAHTYAELLTVSHISSFSLITSRLQSGVDNAGARHFITNFIASPPQPGDTDALKIRQKNQATFFRNIARMGSQQGMSALNSLAFLQNFDPSFKFHPICASGNLSIFSRRLPSSVKHIRGDKNFITSEESSEEDKKVSEVSDSFAWATKKDVSGVYRLFISYLEPDLLDETDLGVVSLVYDPETLKFEGNGRDTLRGPFTIKSGFSKADRESKIKYIASMRHLCPTVMPQSLVLTYKVDGTSLFLNGSAFAYGFSGEFEYVPGAKDLAEEVDSGKFVMPPVDPDDLRRLRGGFTLLYDIEATKSLHASKMASSSSRHSKESMFDELCKINEALEVQKRKERKPKAHLANTSSYFEPWSFSSELDLLYSLRHQLWQGTAIQQELWTESCPIARILAISGALPKLRPEQLKRVENLVSYQTAPQTNLESDFKYHKRALALRIVATLIFELREDIVAAMPPERVLHAEKVLSSRHHPELVQEYAFWNELLIFHPCEGQYHSDLIKARSQVILESKEGAIPPNIFDGSAKDREFGLVGFKAAAIISIAIASLGIGAFFLGKAMHRKKD